MTATPPESIDPGSIPMAYYQRREPLVGILSHPYYRTHRTGDHPEHERKIDRIMDAIDLAPFSGEVMRFLPRYATPEQIAFAHELSFVDLIRSAAAGNGGWLDTDTRIGPGSFDTALLAAGGVIAAVDNVMLEAFHRPDAIFSIVRPPGHHAGAGRAMGFCLFNNVAVAARYAQRTYNLERVMIVDWDVHHGNGTQEIFFDDPSVLFVSLHQWPLYPGSGWLTEIGHGEGAGRTINIPFTPGAGDTAYRHAFERIIEPIAEQFAPELVIVSAGQDCHAADPLSDQLVSLEGFRWMTRAIRRIADRSARGRYLLALEGGYNQHTLPWLCAGIIAAMGDFPDETLDPYEPSAASDREADENRLSEVIAAQTPYWRL